MDSSCTIGQIEDRTEERRPSTLKPNSSRGRGRGVEMVMVGKIII